jgi:hypothetical protein
LSRRDIESRTPCSIPLSIIASRLFTDGNTEWVCTPVRLDDGGDLVISPLTAEDVLGRGVRAEGGADASALAARLHALGDRSRSGISIGKSKITPVDDYLAINVSFPDTPGLRFLEDCAALDALVGGLRAEAAARLVVKIAPTLPATPSSRCSRSAPRATSTVSPLTSPSRRTANSADCPTAR